MKIQAPDIDARRFNRLLEILKRNAPHYTPEWTASEDPGAGAALLGIFAAMTEKVITRLNQVPHKHMVAFLDMLGIRLLPAQPARVPLSFQLAQGSENDRLIPAKTQAAAGDVPFETEENLLAMAAGLKRVISTDPAKDAIYEPPPGFLNGAVVPDEPVAYALASSANKGDTNLQLNHADELEAGDILRIEREEDQTSTQTTPISVCGGCRETEVGAGPEYTTVIDVSGHLVQIGDPLQNPYPAGTPIQKTTWYPPFEGQNLQEHSIYLGHTDLFNLESAGEIVIEVTPAPTGGEGASALSLVWEYWGEDLGNETDAWMPLQIQEDTTGGLSQGGILTLVKTEDGKIKEEALGKIFEKTSGKVIPDPYFSDLKSRWIRCRLKDPLLTGSGANLPGIDTLRAKILLGNGVSPKAAYYNTVPLDWTPEETSGEKSNVNISPFGMQPRLFDTFYIEGQEIFSKKGARIALSFTLDHIVGPQDDPPTPNPTLSWEYWNGSGWQTLPDLADNTNRLLNSGGGQIVEFTCPDDITETAVNGQENFWIRVRLMDGDYGRLEFSQEPEGNNGEIKIKVTPRFKTPLITTLLMSYTFDDSQELGHVVTYNNLDFVDRTLEARSAGRYIQSFTPLEDTHASLHLGFDRRFRSGPFRIFFNARELAVDPAHKPLWAWQYSGKNDWKDLDHQDATEGMTRREILEFIIGSPDFSARKRFGYFLSWLRGAMIQGAYQPGSQPVILGIFLNTTWAFQAESVQDEIIGSSDGTNRPENRGNKQFSKAAVLPGEELRVREELSTEEKQLLVERFGTGAVRELPDESGRIVNWVRWQEVGDFFDSEPNSRHYLLDRATGKLWFGDGRNGMIPPKDNDNIRAFAYQAGGGGQGNVSAGAVNAVRSAVAGLDSVFNPVGAAGGAETATLDQMLEIGPARISHRDRAVSAEDFEWLARDASRKIAKARCLPNTNRNLQTEPGWVTVVIVPFADADEPQPSLELRDIVERHLKAHTAAGLSAMDRIVVRGPSYAPIGVTAQVFVTSIEQAFLVDQAVKNRLKAFFNPLTGGPEGQGWEFGRGVFVSDVYALLENIDGVDHVKNLSLLSDEGETDARVTIPDIYLVANGVHTIDVAPI